MAHRCCANYRRSHQQGRAFAAEAGNGLPSIEAGMPTPAGTGLTRRTFVMNSIGFALTVYGGAKLLAPQAFEEGIAHADAAGRIMVSIFLDGGCDSLELLAPVGDARYRTLRPSLAQDPGSGPAVTEDPTLQWHPAATSLSTLHGEGKLTVVPAVGYDHPDQSHFTSRHYWEVGKLDVNEQVGWLGRFLDAPSVGVDDNPLQGLTLDYDLSPSLATARVPVATVASPTEYNLETRGVDDDTIQVEMERAFNAMAQGATDDTDFGYARRVTGQTARLRQQLRSFTDVHAPVQYPDDGFATRLQALAAMLAVGLPLKCVALRAAGGYDTHSSEAGDFADGMQTTADSLLAFQRDLEARGIADRVIVLLWSEFGRRPEENESQGTDHGAGGACFLIGSEVAGGLLGSFPGLTKLDDDDNLRHSVDFRNIYWSLADEWLGADPEQVVPEAARMPRLPSLLK
jgi:uncharacterized protein (DUF1501 family)